MAIKGKITALAFFLLALGVAAQTGSEESTTTTPVIMQKIAEPTPEPTNREKNVSSDPVPGVVSEGYPVGGNKTEKTEEGQSWPRVYNNPRATPTITKKEQAILAPAEKYSGTFLDTHALAIAADCAPFDASGSRKAAVIPLGDHFFVIPAKSGDLPPYPPNDGKDGVHGVDVNDNCIRDDVEHYIFNEYPSEDQVSVRSNLYAHAIWLNFFLLDPISDRTIQGVARQNIKTGGCLTNLLGEEPGRLARGDLFARMHNTIERTERYFENLDTLSGFTIEENITGGCL